MIRSQNGPDRPPSTFRRSQAPARAPDRHQWCSWCTLGCWLGCWGAGCMRAGMCCHILGRKAQEIMCAAETSWRAPASSGAGTRWLGVRAPTCMTQGRAVAPRIGGGRAGKRLRGRSGARESPRVLARATCESLRLDMSKYVKNGKNSLRMRALRACALRAHARSAYYRVLCNI